MNDSYLMFPVKSVAGIAFGSSGVMHDCELCQKENCPGRKAAFNMKAYLAAKDEEMLQTQKIMISFFCTSTIEDVS